MATPSGHDDDGWRPWEDLPVEMIHAIVKHLDVFSATRLAAVCPSWTDAVASDPTLPFGIPCLLKTRDVDDDGYSCDFVEEDSFELLDLPRLSEVPQRAFIWGAWEQRWVGSKDDWLATVDEYGDARLVNPYTGQQVDLPDINTVVPTGTKTRGTFKRIVVCETPTADSGYLVIAVVSKGILAIASGGGDESWTALRDPDGCCGIRCSDAVVHKGKVFAVDFSGSIYAWDIGAGSFPDAEPELPKPPVNDLLNEFRCQWRLAESADGRRLLLVCIYGKEVDCYETSGYRRHVFIYTSNRAEGVRLYERDVDAATGSDDDDGWSAVTSLGDNSLFLGVNYPFSACIVRRNSSTFPWQEELRPNCVFITNNKFVSGHSAECDLDLFDLGAGGDRYSSLDMYSDRFNDFQTPMWFRPILRNYELE